MAVIAVNCPYDIPRPGPSPYSIAVTKSDTDDLKYPIRAFRVGGATGDVTILNSDGTTCAYLAVAQGETVPACTRRIMSTGTTATGIVGMV